MFEYLRSSEFLQKGGLYSENIRYVLAKKKVEVKKKINVVLFWFKLKYKGALFEMDIIRLYQWLVYQISQRGFCQ